MAVVDRQVGTVVVSVVYDGAPEAGKTTSVRAVAGSFGQTTHTPEERDGRTAFYDWVEHTGGRFQGAPIRCEIVSVPGQARWVRRRAHMLDRADVVVFVGDTRAGAWNATVRRLEDLRRRLDAREGPPVGVVFQANKRDAPDALPLAEVCSAVSDTRIAVVESSAHEGIGVREAFVYAVRLALDRVRDEQARGALSKGTSVFGGRDELLGLLRQLEVEDEPGQTQLPPVVQATREPTPRPPLPTAPSGCVWPPVEGRVILGRAASPQAEVWKTPGGDWVSSLGSDWYASSWAHAVYADLDEARRALVAWARLHAGVAELLSHPRCITVGEESDGRWRLWQVVARRPSLRDLHAPGDDPAPQNGPIEKGLEDVRAALRRLPHALPCTRDTIGLDAHGRAVYVGFVPAPADAAREVERAMTEPQDGGVSALSMRAAAQWSAR